MTASSRPPVLLIAASPGRHSRSSALLGVAAERLHHHGLATRTLRLRDLPAQPLLHADAEDPAIRGALAAVAEARAVVLATPIYKAAYSGLLKVFLDLLPPGGLSGKTVWTLATGGSLAHLLALDYGLLPVLSALGTRSQVDAVYATDAQIAPVATASDRSSDRDSDRGRDEGGDVRGHTVSSPLGSHGYRIDDEVVRRLSVSAAQVLDRLPPPALAEPAGPPLRPALVL
ncbi:NADPH-dependent FMN reductase [Roseateles sp. MS654]|uniref:NADPH-dependent FMN reductase n=1 Tax=Roseateles sp. MS654 TaxID=3412685 RepID=UPI003C2CC5EA